MHFMKKIQVFLENNIIVNLSKKKHQNPMWLNKTFSARAYALKQRTTFNLDERGTKDQGRPGKNNKKRLNVGIPPYSAKQFVASLLWLATAGSSSPAFSRFFTFA